MRLLAGQALVAALAAAIGAVPLFSAEHARVPTSLPDDEVFSYHVEWRMIHAGNARLSWGPSGSAGWAAQLHLESAGLVSRLYKVEALYSSVFDRQSCITSSSLKASEGSRRRQTDVTFDRGRQIASVTDRDLVKNLTQSHEIDIEPCEYDVIGALYRLRTMRLEPGKAIELPVSDGKKAVLAKVEAQERETIKTDFGKYRTIRYEAFLFNNVLYRRRGRLFVWLTDDERRLPVQVRIRLPFYVGTITFQLENGGKA
jgi:hypothetical protein